MLGYQISVISFPVVRRINAVNNSMTSFPAYLFSLFFLIFFSKLITLAQVKIYCSFWKLLNFEVCIHSFTFSNGILFFNSLFAYIFPTYKAKLNCNNLCEMSHVLPERCMQLIFNQMICFISHYFKFTSHVTFTMC